MIRFGIVASVVVCQMCLCVLCVVTVVPLLFHYLLFHYLLLLDVHRPSIVVCNISFCFAVNFAPHIL